MKQTILPFSIFFFTILFAFQSQAQVTIARNDFPRLASFTDSLHFTEEAGIAVPSEGPNQVWDYSALESGEFRTFEHFDATSDPNFPDALNLRQGDLLFQIFEIESQSYEAIDDVGFYEYGRSITDVTYSITAISGGPNDSLRFVGGNELYEGDIDEIEFPMTYQDAWTDSRNEYINFELTIAAFGLNQTPGFRKRIKTQIRTVVGHGLLTIPKSDGSPSLEMDVLLVKVERSNVDSLFLGGAPAPPAILAAFGLVQGAVDEVVFYSFYKPGFAGRVLDIGISDIGQATDAFYRPQAADGLTAIHELEGLPEIQGLPNPVSAGGVITLPIQQLTSTGFIRFYDLIGRSVFSLPFESGTDYQIQARIPTATGTGMYIYHVHDEKGVPVGLGKLQIN